MFDLSERRCAQKMCFFYIISKNFFIVKATAFKKKKKKRVFFILYQIIFKMSISGIQLSTKHATIWGVLGRAALSISRGSAGASKRSAELSTFNQM